MKKLIVVLFAAFISVNSFSQSNFVNGYVLKSEYDTLYGFINEKNYNFNSRFCEFRVSDKSEVLTYLPDQIYGYVLTGKKFYVAKKISTNNILAPFFLEFLLDGEMDIYFRQDENKINHFYASKDPDLIYELLNTNSTYTQNGTSYLKENKEYIGTLKVLTGDYPSFAGEIEKPFKLKQNNLVNLGEKYHSLVCPDQNCVVYFKRQRVKVIIELEVAYTGYTKNISWYEAVSHSTKGIRLLFNNPEFNENFYLGIGYIYEGPYKNSQYNEESRTYNNSRIPLTVAYYTNKKGFSPSFSSSFNLELLSNDVGQSISLTPGIKYGYNEVNFILFTDLTVLLSPPSYFSTAIGIKLNLKL